MSKKTSMTLPKCTNLFSLNPCRQRLTENILHSKGFNFDEGRYISEMERQKEIEEERELITELNERIFKLHKSIKEKQIEEQEKTMECDLAFLRHLDDFESLALCIFTNNTVYFIFFNKFVE